MMKYSLFLICLSFCFSMQAQVGIIKYEYGCSYDGDTARFDEITVFSPDEEAKEIIQNIMSFIGLQANFTIKAGDVEKAIALIDSAEGRVIVYSQDFIRRAKNINDWAATSILTHEIGHHLNGHIFLDGVNPKGKKLMSKSLKEMELEADIFSGFHLHNMGATLEEAQAAIQSLTGENLNGKTHPPKKARLAAIENGWTKAKEKASSKKRNILTETNSEDRDGDGVSDKNDACPEYKGLEKYFGCPETGNFETNKTKVIESPTEDDEKANMAMEEAKKRFKSKDYKNAKEYYNLALKFKPLLWEAYYDMAKISVEKLEYQQALSDINITSSLYEKLLETKADALNLHTYYEILSSKAYIYMRSEDFSKMYEVANSILEKDKSHARAWTYRAIANLYLKKEKEAKSDLTEAIRLNDEEALKWKKKILK